MDDINMQDLKTQDLKLQNYFVFSVTAVLGQIIGLLFTSLNLNPNLKHHNYELVIIIITRNVG